MWWKFGCLNEPQYGMITEGVNPLFLYANCGLPRSGKRSRDNDMKDWKHSLFSFRIRLLAAGAGAALLAGTALPSVTAAFAGQQDALSGTTEAGAGQAGSQTDAGSSGALSSQTGQSTITDGGAGQSSDGGVPDGIDISGGGNGDGSLSNGSAQQTVGSDSSIPQQGSSADPQL